MSDGAINEQLASGQWVRVLPRVFRDASFPVTWEQRLLAALLWAGPGAFSHRSAAALWRLDAFEDEIVEITCPRGLRPRWRGSRSTPREPAVTRSARCGG